MKGARAVRIRPIGETEFEVVGRMWQESMHRAYTWLRPDQFHPLDEALRYFTGTICVECEVFIAVRGDEIVGVLALDEQIVDHLFVHPDHWRSGIGTLLLEHAMELRPEGLQLVTLQRNERARRFYEAHGFVVTKTGTSPPPESEPDVWYAWRSKRKG